MAIAIDPGQLPFEVGDVVQLKSGGGKMVVEEIKCRGYLSCIYWLDGPPHADTGAFRYVDLHCTLLHKVDPVPTQDDLPF